jgi:hypothetical protein
MESSNRFVGFIEIIGSIGLRIEEKGARNEDKG